MVKRALYADDDGMLLEMVERRATMIWMTRLIADIESKDEGRLRLSSSSVGSNALRGNDI